MKLKLNHVIIQFFIHVKFNSGHIVIVALADISRVLRKCRQLHACTCTISVVIYVHSIYV